MSVFSFLQSVWNALVSPVRVAMENERLKAEIVRLEREKGDSHEIYAASYNTWQMRIRYLLNELCLRYKKKKELRMRVTELEAEVAKLEKQRWRDSLTGLLLREGIKENFHVQVELLRRKGLLEESSSVVLLDMDDFSRINDEHGHPAGDAAIVAVAKVIESCFRESDVLGRWGGDEFVVVMPNTPKKNISERLEKLRKRLSTITSDDLGGLQIEKQISASIGVAQLDVHPNTGDELWAELSKVIAKADSAMYEGKKNGKGHIVVAE